MDDSSSSVIDCTAIEAAATKAGVPDNPAARAARHMLACVVGILLAHDADPFALGRYVHELAKLGKLAQARARAVEAAIARAAGGEQSAKA